MNKFFKKAGAVALSALMTIGLASQGISTVSAASTYTVQYYGKSTAYGSTVGNFSINGRRGWCFEHKKTTPGGTQVMTGTISTSTDPKIANVRKIQYYGKYGYAQWSGLNGLTDDQCNVIMSKCLSHAYSGTAISKGIMTNFYNYATSQPDPINMNNLLFSKNQLNTYYDQNAKVQKSESATLSGPAGYHININTGSSSVRIVNEMTGKSGQSVDVYGGNRVHYEADASYTGSVKSGNKSGGFTFAPLICWNGKANYQHIGTWVIIDPIKTTYLNADFKAVNGSIKLKKTDEAGKALDGAVFTVKGNSYEKDVTVAGGDTTLNDVPAGDYTVTEKTAPNGYLLNNGTFTATVKANETAEVTITDTAPTGKITIKKSDSEGNVQGEASLEGAEYTVYNAEGKEAGVIKTDKDGNGSLENLELGKYTVKETKAPEAYDLDPTTYTVELTYKDQTTAIILGNVDSKENVKKGRIVVEKTDTQNNPLKGGEFGIYADADMYIGGTLYKKGQLVSSIKTDESGKAKSELLPYGHYYIKETKAPTAEDGNKDNFVIASETQYVNVTGKTENSEITFVDKKVTATKTDIAGSSEIKGAEMTVTDSNGQVVDTWVSDGYSHSIKCLEEGKKYTLTEKSAPDGYVKAESVEFTVSDDKKDQKVTMKDKQVKITKTDATGKNEVEGAKLIVKDEQDNIVDSWTSGKEAHYVNGLEEGKTYRLIEETAPEGYTRAEDVYFTVSNEKKDQSVIMKDEQITVTKTDVTGKKEVEGAELAVKDEKGNVVDSWTSGKEAHYVNGLEEGKTYTLEEVTAPDGYVKAESIEFTAGSDADQNLVMKDSRVTAKKTDVAGKEVEGAEMTVTDKDGNVIDKWTSGKEEHAIKGLETGKTYVLTETAAPKGYVKAESIEFTVGNDADQNLVMKDKQVTVTKTDITGKNEVEGAEMTVTDEQGNVIDKWTSGKEAHAVSGLEEGKNYVLTEKTAPKGYVKATSINFSVSSEKKDQTVDMNDKQVVISKEDVAGKEVKGAKLTVKDEDGNTVDSWTSGDKPHYVSGLEEGKKYTLTEETAPKGYVRSETITFTVTDKKDIQKVTMVDTQVRVSKTDAETTEDVKGAEFTVFDKDGNVIDKWTTDGGYHAVDGLDAGKEYIIKETKIPEGYQTAADRTFVAPEDQDMDLEIKEQPVLTDIQVNKVDAQTKKVIKSKDFEFTMYSDADCKNEIAKASANKEEGTATFKSLRYGTYYIKETKAPEGYLLSKEVKKVVIDDKLENVGKTYSFVYQDTPMPAAGGAVKTGDDTNIRTFEMMGGVSAIVLLTCVLNVLRKKKAER